MAETYSPIGGGGSSMQVSEGWLRVAVATLGPVLYGQEAARRAYHEQPGAGARFTKARTTAQQTLLDGWREACRALGMDDDLRHW